MGPDCYQVEVLHYINPHLIWVEVVDSERKKEFVFEQVGIYGVVPYETAIDISSSPASLEGQKCSKWLPAATVAMKQCLSKASEVWFRPTHIDRRTSIFDDNIHKYGELLIKTNDNQLIELSTALTQSGFALYDICIFLQQLSLGELNTKLSNAKTLEVIKHLEKDSGITSKRQREKSVKKQTSVFNAAHNFESKLTITNLERHNKHLKHKNIDELVQEKIKDFDKCKDIDEVSVGRASNVKHTENHIQTVPLFLKKKLELNKAQRSKPNDDKKHLNSPLEILMATKRFLEENSRIVDSKSLSPENELKAVKSNEHMKSNEVASGEKNEHTYKLNRELLDDEMEDGDMKVGKENIRNSLNKVKKHKRSSKVPEYDIETEQRVAYGPPGLDAKYLTLKILPKSKEEETILVPTDNKIEILEHKGTYAEILEHKDAYANVDSLVDIKITNTDVLKESLINNNNVSIDYTDSNIGEVKKLGAMLNDSNTTDESTSESKNRSSRFTMLQKKLKIHKEICSIKPESSVTSTSDTTNKDSSSSNEEIKPKKERKKTEYLDSDDDEITGIIEKVNKEYNVSSIKKVEEPKKAEYASDFKMNVNVNPFKNIDVNISVFVDKLVAPVLMVHSKMNKRIEPNSNIRDVNFNAHIHEVLKNMSIERPMMLQMVSWPVILRGYSLFMVSPLGSGKTIGYLPAICRLITDAKSEMSSSVGPTCIIVCATSQSVSDVERLARMFLGLEEKVLTCYAGMDELQTTTSLLNGCDLFICTPSVLVRLLQLTDFGVDLRRLTTFVLEDCERLTEVYASEVKFFLVKIKEMLKNRANKELKVQFIVASRVWCDFLEPLAVKAPNSVVCIGAFQECVLYSKATTTVNFVKKENKNNHVLDFLKDIDNIKRTVIVCRSDEEVNDLEKILTKHKYIVFACNSTMTVEDLYGLSKLWVEYEEPLLGPILICRDGNLTHLNVTDAHYLIHYSLPQLFSMFCKRFSVLNDNYPTIFKEENDSVRIKVFLENSNVEQLPKILNFIKRCTNNVPEFLDEICENILQEKDTVKGKNFVPVCDNLLSLGECQDFWNCQERHAIFPEYDKPKDWVPTTGIVKFKILHYHSAVHYSSRLLSNSVASGTKKYPQTYSTLSLKMGMYFSKEANKKLLTTPKVGDVCAVSVKQNFFARCQVLKIINYYNNGTPNWVLIKLIDEEKLERARDIYLYYLPDELKKIETHVVQVRLANIRPKDKDVTFSDLAKRQLMKITDADDDLYMRGQVVLTIGNCVYVDTLDVCQELTSLNETVVRSNFKKELLDKHGIANADHLARLKSLCKDCDFNIQDEQQNPETVKQKNPLSVPQWAHLESNELTSVFFASAESPGTFFVRLTKFESCLKQLLKEVDRYMEQGPEPVNEVERGDIVLAKFPDDGTYERARIDEILDEGRVKCFYVDQGDWREVSIKDLLVIPDKFVTQMPFQAIECRLIGAKPSGEDWTEFGTNWFNDSCFELDNGDLKQLYVTYFTKDKSEHTGGSKYGVVLIDTNSDQDVVINQLMIDLNLAQENEEEIHFLSDIKLHTSKPNSTISVISSVVKVDMPEPISLLPVTKCDDASKESLNNKVLGQPIRSLPLVDSDNESDASDKWDIVNPADFASGLKGLIPDNQDNKPTTSKATATKEHTFLTVKNTLPAIKNVPNDISSQQSTLDSDDLSSPQSSQLSEKFKKASVPTEKTKIVSKFNFPGPSSEHEDLRKPKLLWRQNKSYVMVKILLIGVDNYNLKIKERSIDFFAVTNNTNYGFGFDLYGVIDPNSAVHSNKGQYILVKFNKLMKRNWLTLTKDGSMRKWIVYDVDSIDASSDEEDSVVNPLAELAKNLHNNDRDSDSDDEFLDDINYEYKREFN